MYTHFMRRYLTRIVHNDHWTILDSYNDAKKLPDGTKCPAYALAARISSSGEKEVILSIRGSATPMDWCINFDEESEDFEYHIGFKRGGGCVRGVVHKGSLTCIYINITYITTTPSFL